jgi:hypothetical protein
VLIEPVRCGDIEVQLARPEAARSRDLRDAAIEEAPYWADAVGRRRAPLGEVVAAPPSPASACSRSAAAWPCRRWSRRRAAGDTIASDVDAHRSRTSPPALARRDSSSAPACSTSPRRRTGSTPVDLVLAADVLYVDASAAQLAARAAGRCSHRAAGRCYLPAGRGHGPTGSPLRSPPAIAGRRTRRRGDHVVPGGGDARRRPRARPYRLAGRDALVDPEQPRPHARLREHAGRERTDRAGRSRVTSAPRRGRISIAPVQVGERPGQHDPALRRWRPSMNAACSSQLACSRGERPCW